MSNPSILVLDRLADGRIGLDEAVRRLMMIRSLRARVAGKQTAVPVPAAPTAPSYFDGITAERLN